MITPSQIREKNLSTVQSGGYDKEEVNALLAQIVESYQAVYDENKELYRKMEILAGKIEEYRSEEDSIKTALITAQKMADRIAKDAKEKAEEKLSASAATAQQTVTDAKEKADKMVAEARTYAANFTKEKQDAAESIITEAEAKANDATKLAILDSFDTVLSLSLLKKAASVREANAKAQSAKAEGGYTVTGEGDPAIDALVLQRYEAKKTKNFAEADRIRDELKAQGIEITDTKDGTSWKRV